MYLGGEIPDQFLVFYQQHFLTLQQRGEGFRSDQLSTACRSVVNSVLEETQTVSEEICLSISRTTPLVQIRFVLARLDSVSSVSQISQDSRSGMKQTRVLLVDDHTLVRAGIRALLERIDGIKIVAEAGDGLQALELIVQHQPDLVLLDLTLPKLGGLEVLKRAQQDYPSVRFIVLTMHEQGEYAIKALRLGAAGFIPKSAASNELENAIHMVLRGENYLSPRIPQQSILRHLKDAHASGSASVLTPRQCEILELIALGRTTKQIAQKLNIAVKTVESHRTQIMDRLDIHDVVGLARYAIRTGLVPVED